ncbi:MAG: hypothetical protein IH988_08985 [Planctomycetes bacterium]|nr:hypothetical protein [Planctomycetota bacterium]
MLADTSTARLATNCPGEYDRTVTTGFYDPSLVCEACERKFSPWDGYGKAILLDTDWESAQVGGDDRRAYCIRSFDYTRLKLFFMSVLWRIAGTARREFRQVDLGPHGDKLARDIESCDPGGIDDWSVTLARFVGSHPAIPELEAKVAWLDPHRTRFGGVNCVNIYMADFIAMIKVDQRPFGEPVRRLCIARDKPLYIIIRDFGSSKELALMTNMARQQA